ncbi:hypothetical protein [Geobacillus thermodenitrificans]|uniref:Secreted protein n=1 Tax=Geobacillus thermodenitrificans (strain NG80-2) TaxID=420246 RepID=A4ITZ9_GEOTN|nr:hypothetical protein [Geobacillus thermodenitrificans]ABO68803.1 Hypothetical protein GTNG_3470 [Geobacillus thermodenitrificans NG80-2]
MKGIKKFLSLTLFSLAFTFLLVSPKAFADTHIQQLNLGTYTYYNFLTEEYLDDWGVYWETRTKAQSKYKGVGKDPIYLYTYYTKQIDSWGAKDDIVHKSDMWLVDSYNNKTYVYYTYCNILYNAQTITINKSVGWSSSYNPYLTYNLKPGICAGSKYVVVNHVFVNAK